MTEELERRHVRRAVVTGRLTGRMSPLEDFRLLDLSLAGARIEHLAHLRPGDSCTLRFRAPSRSLTLVAQVIWSTVIGREPTRGGLRSLRYHSGLRFNPLSPEQARDLTELLERLLPEAG